VKTLAVTTPPTGDRPRLATVIAWIQILTGVDVFGLVAGIGMLKGKPWGWRLGLFRSGLFILAGLVFHTAELVFEEVVYCYYNKNELYCTFHEEITGLIGTAILLIILFGYVFLNLYRDDVIGYYFPKRGGVGKSKGGINIAGWVYVILGVGFGITLPAGIGLLKKKKWGWWAAIITGWILSFSAIASWIYGWSQGNYSGRWDARWAMEEAVILMTVGGIGIVTFSLITMYLYRPDIRPEFKS
jgi:hypothetical protein